MGDYFHINGLLSFEYVVFMDGGGHSYVAEWTARYLIRHCGA
jgi:hypothetical protein